MSKYSIADYVKRGEVLSSFAGGFVFDAGDLSDAQFIDVSKVVQMALPDDGGSSVADHIPVRPPFDSTWLEWAVGDQLEKRLEGPVNVSRGAAYLQMCPDDEIAPLGITPPVGTVAAGVVSTYIMSRSSPLHVAESVQALMYFDSDGLASWRVMHEPDRSVAETDLELRKAMFANTVLPAFFALGLMNCRNVSVAEAPPVKRTKKQRRDKVPRITFRTLVLPSEKSTSASAKVDRSAFARAFHMVRGHFKTYTEDAPLMGKFTGTYWWGWQTRGQKKNGIVVKDYEVHSA